LLHTSTRAAPPRSAASAEATESTHTSIEIGSPIIQLRQAYFSFIFSTNLPMLTTARPTVPRPIS
jgi:hypothetical protein